MNYSSSHGFDSINKIMREIDKGYIIRNIHKNGSMGILIIVIIHIYRSIKYTSYTIKKSWIVGIIIYFFLIFIGFLGYTLPNGQMSYWGGTVITNLITVIPYIGENIKIYIWGNYNIGIETLNRFYSLHYLLPILLLIPILLHLYFVHEKGGNNKIGIKEEYINLNRYFTIKDIMSFLLFSLIFIYIVFYKPTTLGHVDNYIESNPLVTPSHIVPELYLLPYYTILRSIEEKRIGVILLLLSILIFILLPYIQPSLLINTSFRTLYTYNLYFFIFNYFYIGYMGTEIVIKPYIYINTFLTLYYFYYIIRTNRNKYNRIYNIFNLKGIRIIYFH